MSKIDGDIFKLEEQLKKVKSKLADLNNAKREEENKIIHRKQLLIGEMILRLMSENPEYEKEILQLIKKTFKKSRDKKLFGITGLIKPLGDITEDPYFS